jgi:hypothetical protein
MGQIPDSLLQDMKNTKTEEVKALEGTQEVPNVEPTPQEEVTEQVTNEVQEEVKVEEAKPEEPIDPLADFDDEIEVVKEETPYDFAELGKALEFGEIKTKDDLISKTREIKQQLQELQKQKDSLYAGLPEDLKRDIELAKQGVDVKAIRALSSIDYTKVDPISLFEQDVVRMYTDPATGKVDNDKVDAFLDRYTDDQMEFEGKKIQQQYVNYQQQELSRLEREASQRRQEADKQLKQAISSVDSISGLKVKDNVKNDLYGELSHGKFRPLLEAFTNNQGQVDYRGAFEAAYKIKYFDKVTTHLTEKAKNSGKKEVYNQITNAQIRKPEIAPAPENRPKSKAEELLDTARSGRRISIGR